MSKKKQLDLKSLFDVFDNESCNIVDTELNPTTKASNSTMYEAIEDNNLERVKTLLGNGMDVNEPIITTGEFAGFTALHVACMKNKNHLVKLLLNDYKANVDATAADGTRPIHLACFYEYHPKLSVGMKFFFPVGWNIRSLVNANANADAEFGQEIFSKHLKDSKWCPDFGDKMTPLIFAVLYLKPLFMPLLGKVNANFMSFNNKTLLMYALQNPFREFFVEDILKNLKDPELINHRDNDGIPAIHYLVHPRMYGNCRYYDPERLNTCRSQAMNLIRYLTLGGADIYALINNDPATFLPNLFAYRSYPELLRVFLPHYTDISLSRVLYYATLPIDEDSDNLFRNGPTRPDDRNSFIETIKERREETIKVVINDLVFRREFNLPVPEEEIKLMDKLIATNVYIRMIVNNHKILFIEDLKNLLTEFRGKKISMYNFMIQIYDDEKFMTLARDKSLRRAWAGFKAGGIRHLEPYILYQSIKIKIGRATMRLNLLNKLEKISSLREAIPLPYELILDIVQYLNNKELNEFIGAFYNPYTAKKLYKNYSYNYPDAGVFLYKG
ncbi:Similar to ASB3: Ankyrin repeat and SOCS box protein 3 (Bos taurus) [Cotesia congregata]|uniref:Similar to ASB3: Ankyrin repeat and SOCS box protein 3 (Bos taurus) n=1 Tax=Cotesia congregata TaxID=51543 RepID=A0A8J2MTT5_COTCN|nr:Similar to ASB3: Ankyrin repeat and SOCS box protein 3 (Bos taurus) [Cotesia congregata]